MISFARMVSLTCLLALAACLGGCGGASMSDCGGYFFVVTVTPTSAVVNHLASPPKNQIQFHATGRATAPPGCGFPADLEVVEYAAWSNPDSKDIQISSANDSTNGTAVCLNATNGSVTLTGTFSPSSPDYPAGSGQDKSVKTVTLTCQ
jgi:hypothetical protein